jgi:hypothetical protein
MKIFRDKFVDPEELRQSRKAILFNLAMAIAVSWIGAAYFVYHAITSGGPSWWLAYFVMGLFYGANALAGDPFYYIRRTDPNRYAVLHLAGITIVWLPVMLTSAIVRILEIYRWQLEVFGIHRAIEGGPENNEFLTEDELFEKYPEG